MEKLTGNELIKWIQSVFPKQRGDRNLGILVDIPQNSRKDHPDWKQRRGTAEEWFKTLKYKTAALGLVKVALIAYPDVGAHDADLPRDAFLIFDKLPSLAFHLEDEDIMEPVSFSNVFNEFQLLIVCTQYSTAVPLENAAKRYGFRAARMPDFSNKGSA